ncbi:MAG: hypothetical protein Q8M94_11420 [Ignavibacteria bacterium]|nr:hypothetical protein [Ignavibacteria bacterium]
MSETYIFNKDMGEISGLGGPYEECCRAMLKSGLEWWDTFPDANPEYYGFKNVYGICVCNNNDARDLDRAIHMGANWDMTGAMHQAVVNTILWIHKNGWDAYVKEMTS